MKDLARSTRVIGPPPVTVSCSKQGQGHWPAWQGCVKTRPELDEPASVVQLSGNVFWVLAGDEVLRYRVHDPANAAAIIHMCGHRGRLHRKLGLLRFRSQGSWWTVSVAPLGQETPCEHFGQA